MRIPFTNIEIFSTKTKTVENMANQQVPTEARPSFKIPNEMELTRTKQDIASWRSSLLMAESLKFPNRMELYRLYKDVVMDAHVTACITTRKNGVLGSKFIVTKDGVENEQLTKLISKKWFYDFVSLALDAIYWGYSLIEFGDLVNDEFINTHLACERQYVKQEFNLIVATPSQLTGWDYTQPPFVEWNIGVGEKRDLGLLAKVAPLFLYKKQAMVAWSQYSDLFGVPVRVGKLSKKERQTFDEMVSFLKNMGNSAYAVIGKDDEIELLETGKTSGQEVFNSMISMLNNEISKLILGQTGTTDEKSFVGSANVHERILGLYLESDTRFIENVFTHQLIPFLIKYHNFPLQGYKIEIAEDDELSLIEKSKIDIELLKTGLYVAPVDYLKTTYGTELELLEQKAEESKATDEEVKNIKNELDKYYGDL